MKIAKVRVKFLRQAPRKVRLVASLLRNLSVVEAEAQLMHMANRAAKPILKAVRSAKANAQVLKMDLDKLVISKITVDGGPMLKRFLPRARGSASEIQKKMSHLLIELSEREAIKKARFVIPATKKIKAKTASEGVARPKKDKPAEEEGVAKKASKGFSRKIFTRKTGTA